MTTYTIQSECGIMDIEAETIEAAKEIYSRERHYDFEAVAETEGSWYSISVDGLQIEGRRRRHAAVIPPPPTRHNGREARRETMARTIQDMTAQRRRAQDAWRKAYRSADLWEKDPEQAKDDLREALARDVEATIPESRPWAAFWADRLYKLCVGETLTPAAD